MIEYANEVPEAADGFKSIDEIAGGDFIEVYRLINALLKGLAHDFDVYDAADWSVVAALSEQ